MTNLEMRKCEVAIATLPKIADALNRIADSLADDKPDEETKDFVQYVVKYYDEEENQWFTADTYDTDCFMQAIARLDEFTREVVCARIDKMYAHRMTRDEICNQIKKETKK